MNGWILPTLLFKAFNLNKFGIPKAYRDFLELAKSGSDLFKVLYILTYLQNYHPNIHKYIPKYKHNSKYIFYESSSSLVWCLNAE